MDNAASKELEEDQLKQKVADLQEQKKALLGSNPTNSFDELFRELRLAKERVTQVESQLNSRDLVTGNLGFAWLLF